MPRQVALEVSDSVHKVFFPFELDSGSALSRLDARRGLNPDCLRSGAAIYRTERERDISHSYLGCRLVALYRELQDPNPRGILEK